MPSLVHQPVHQVVQQNADYRQTKRKEIELDVEKEATAEPDRKKRKGTPLREKKGPRSEMKDKFNNKNLITNHFQLFSSAQSLGDDRLHAQQGGGDLDGGGDKAVPRAHAKKLPTLARVGVGGKTEQFEKKAVVGQPPAADAKQSNSGQFYIQQLRKVYSGETGK